MYQKSSLRSRTVGAAFALVFAASSCATRDSESNPTFDVQATNQAVASDAPIAVSERYVAYLALESETGDGLGATAVDLNGDGDTDDSVVHVVDTFAQTETNVGVAAIDVMWAGQDLYMIVNEPEDAFDWDGDGLGDDPGDPDELSLIHWAVDTDPPKDQMAPSDRFVATPESLPGPGTEPAPVLVLDDLLFFEEEIGFGMTPGPFMTSLRVVDPATHPTDAVVIPTGFDVASGLRPRILGVDEGLVFLALDESDDGVELNDDGTAGDDGFVLALMDGTSAMTEVHNTQLAVVDETTPLRACAQGTGDWLVAFLVNEAAQPEPTLGQGFNNRDLFVIDWLPGQCVDVAHDDTDTADDVLHYIHFADWVTDSVANPPRNTGLSGRERVLVVDGYVATITYESDESNCNLNLDDADAADRVLRWVRAVTGTEDVVPDAESFVNFRALAPTADVAGSTFNVAELQGRFVIVVSEVEDDQDHNDDKLVEQNLLGVFDPGSSAEWTFNHSVSSSGFYVGSTWLSETPDRLRLLNAAPEGIQGTNFNERPQSPCGDDDMDDSVATFHTATGIRLSFPFEPVAVDADDAAMTVIRNRVFYRVDEADDSCDWNGDDDTDDVVLFRTQLSDGRSFYMGPALPSSGGRPAVFGNPSEATPRSGAFLSREADEGPSPGVDLNGDGDTDDVVLRYFRM